MSFCFVPGCNSGYSSQRKDFKKHGKKIPSLFSCCLQGDLEKWNRAIPRANKSVTAKDKVCELHFDINDIERYFNHKFPDGSIHSLERERPLLKPGTIPTIFPNLTDHFSRKSQARKTPVEYVPATKKIKVCELNFVESDFEREASAYDPKAAKRLSSKLSNDQLKKGVPSLSPNCRNYLSRRECRRQDPKERHIRLENEKLQNTVQQSLKSSSENQNQLENAVPTLLVPINILKQVDFSTSHWNKNEETALIALYQSEKCLYDKRHRHYHNLREKSEAWERIKNVLAKMNFIGTVKQIRGKITSLRSKYASEKSYKDECIQAGKFTENTYAPTMWCFGLLQFLDNYMEPRKDIEIIAETVEKEPEKDSNMGKYVPLKISSSFTLIAGFNEDYKMKPKEVSNMKENVPLKINLSCSLNTGFNKSLRVNKRGMEANVKISASNKLHAINIFSQDSEEKEDIFGEYIASEMKTLKDNRLLYMQTKQAIIDVLTNANFVLVNTE